MWWDWTPGNIAWGITDASGALRDHALKATRFKPAGELVHLNLWLADGHSPAAGLAIEIASFTHIAL